jgi:RNA polymerase sigma-70 factor (ECF subfamily)
MGKGPGRSMDEREIIAGCLRGAAGSYREMVEAYGPLVLAVALNVLGNKEDAEDVFQETFISVFKNLGRYDSGRSFKTWLLTIVYRRSLDMIKKKRRFSEFADRAKHEPAVMANNPGPDRGDPGTLPARFLKGLSAKERTALCLWANEGYTALDISRILGCSASTARVTLFNARRKIKLFLENEHGVLQNC